MGTPVKILAAAIVVASLTAAPANATFPGENGQIVFMAWVEDSPGEAGWDVFAVQPDGSGLRRLTNMPDGMIYNPEVSPDGRRVVFSYFPWDRQTNWEFFPSPYKRYPGSDLYVVDIDGSNLVQLTKTRRNELMPTWSPSGKRIAFMSPDRTKTRQVFMMSADGSGKQRQVTHMRSDVWSPEWAPQGRRIAFTVHVDSGTSELYTIRSGGKGLRRLTYGAAAVAPSWSPNGRKLVFHDHRHEYWNPNWQVCYEYGGPCNLEIYSIDADGRNERRLTDNSATDIAPTWSPDGREIAFVSDRLDAWGFLDLWVMKPDGSEPRLVEGTSLFPVMPSWQRLQPESGG